MRQALGGSRCKRTAVPGLSPKPIKDDMRDAASIPTIKSVLAEGVAVAVYGPMAAENATSIFQHNIEYADHEMKCIEKTDYCIIVG